MVRLASLRISNMFQPSFFFPEILNNQKESFADISPQVLEEFVENSVFRANQDRYIFDHLNVSVSTIHSHFVPLNEISIQIFNRISKDLLSSEKLQIDQVKLLSKIYSSELILKSSF